MENIIQYSPRRAAQLHLIATIIVAKAMAAMSITPLVVIFGKMGAAAVEGRSGNDGIYPKKRLEKSNFPKFQDG
jgi:hypothetical protein